jgi:hypothetical protein
MQEAIDVSVVRLLARTQGVIDFIFLSIPLFIQFVSNVAKLSDLSAVVSN